MAGEERNGRVTSGDVSLFYRAFGARGATPILLMHGANYYDSYDIMLLWPSANGQPARYSAVIGYGATAATVLGERWSTPDRLTV